MTSSTSVQVQGEIPKSQFAKFGFEWEAQVFVRDDDLGWLMTTSDGSWYKIAGYIEPGRWSPDHSEWAHEPAFAMDMALNGLKLFEEPTLNFKGPLHAIVFEDNFGMTKQDKGTKLNWGFSKPRAIFLRCASVEWFAKHKRSDRKRQSMSTDINDKSPKASKPNSDNGGVQG